MTVNVNSSYTDVDAYKINLIRTIKEVTKTVPGLAELNARIYPSCVVKWLSVW